MKTAVIGYPRIGTLRELKFASEKYFRNEITEEELKETAAQLKKNRDGKDKKDQRSIRYRQMTFLIMI